MFARLDGRVEVGTRSLRLRTQNARVATLPRRKSMANMRVPFFVVTIYLDVCHYLKDMEHD